ncbi:MAG: flagellar M-ring protein FliF [Ignavibacteriales bacterium]|nr:MAG: flagellar M-ring protein FliF [Ignavibacteriales bacterium]
MNKNPLEALLGIFNKISLQQKLLIGIASIIAVVLLISALVFLNEPSYSVLYSNLSQEDASKVLEVLNTQKIPYKIEDNGSSIKVPKDKVYETRLVLAGKGIPNSGIIGYEIFDKTTMGMSEFMQKLNYKRALEGELARTIMQQDGIQGARVHIVFPAKTVFKDDEKLPTASVVLKLSGGTTLSQANVAAIVNLISSSVEGLVPGKVTLLDTKGRLLSKENNEDPLAVSSSKQYEMKQSVENYLSLKAQNILDNVVGYDNAIVKVDADINFDQIEKTMELYDPDSQVAVSEQNVRTESNGRNMSDTSVTVSENSTTNYEISKTIQRVVEGSGTIKRLSVAVVINDIPKEVVKDEKTEIVYEPRSQEQMRKLEEIVKNAVGLNPERQDQFSIVSIPFETRLVDDVQLEEPTIIEDVNEYINPLLILVAIGASLFILRGLMTKLKNEKIIIGSIDSLNLNTEHYSQPAVTSGSTAQAPQIKPAKRKGLLQVGDLEDEISDEAVLKKTQQEKISNYVSKNPMDAAKLINAWLHEDEFESKTVH